jgi:hypothetical protein
MESSKSERESQQLEHLADDVELRHAPAKTLKGFCLTYLPHRFPADLSDFFDEMAGALQDHSNTRLEIIGFRGCAKSAMASLDCGQRSSTPTNIPFIIMLAGTRGQACCGRLTRTGHPYPPPPTQSSRSRSGGLAGS